MSYTGIAQTSQGQVKFPAQLWNDEDLHSCSSPDTFSWPQFIQELQHSFLFYLQRNRLYYLHIQEEENCLNYDNPRNENKKLFSG